MAATIPRPSRPSLGPPTSALPPLPTPKTRKSAVLSTPTPTTPQTNGASLLSIKPSLNRSASYNASNTSSTATPHNASTSNLPTPHSLLRPASQSLITPSKGLRRTVSVAAFPHPPGASVSRIASLPPSPLSGGTTPITTGGGIGGITPSRPSPPDTSPVTPGGSKLQKPKKRTSAATQNFNLSSTPSLLNGSGDSRSISSGPGGRGSDGLLSLPSPPQSRSSSAEGSYSTTATTFEDWGNDGARGREGAHDSARDSKESSTKGKEGKGNVIVSVRVRPDANTGDGTNSRTDEEWMVDGRRSLIAFKGREGGEYYYDNVFTPHDKNAKIYDASAKRLVRRVMEGYHGTVFAYGMTGTGKTFSMQGTTTSPGVIPLAITDIFSYIRETPHREFLLRVSYLEIYNEKIHDLLTPPPAGTGPNAGVQEEIKLREDAKRGVYATPLKEEIVQSPTQLLRVIARGDHQRRTGSTQYNARSSRSHAVVQIVVESRERMPGGDSMENGRDKRSAVPGGVRVSTLSLIDLAGSERAAESKERRAEGAHINRSLLTLGTVIARLSGDKDKDGNPTDKDGKHLPYRDSKLTRLLQPALSGNSLVSILCTIQIGAAGSAAAANSHTGETLNTLKFAARAKNNIVSHAKKAEEALGSGVDAGSRVLLERYRVEIQELRTQLEIQAKQKNEEEEREREKEAEQRHGEQMLEMQLARTALKERIEHLNRLILCSKSTGVNASGTYSSLGAHPRLSGISNGHLSSLSMRSSGTQSTLGIRPVSNGSASTIGQLPNGNNAAPHPPGENGSEDDDSTGEYGDGTASLAAQVRALQADLADKNRYISTLEKRLLQARRSSQSRTSIGFSPPNKIAGLFVEDGMGMLLKEKDAEIADLRARLDDKERMVGALRSAARKRDVADVATDPEQTKLQRRKSSSHSNNGSVSNISPVKGRKRTKSVDEMSRMLDEMIQDRVESGELVKGSRGSVRIAADRKRRDLSMSIPGVEALKAPALPSIACAEPVS